MSDKNVEGYSTDHKKHASDLEITDAIEELENVNSYLYYIAALLEKIFDIKVAKNVEVEFNKISKKLAPDLLNLDRLFNQTPDLPDKNNFK